MRPIAILTTVIFFLASAAHAQDITLSRHNIPLSQLFDEIKKQIGYDFLYNPKVLQKAKPVDVEAVKTPLRTVLDNCFANQPLTYTIDQHTIIVKEKTAAATVALPVIKGSVMNKDKKPVENASVFLSNATIGGKTDADGNFRLDNVKPGSYDLVVSIVGYETRHQAITVNDKDVDLSAVEIVPKTIGLNEVVIKSHRDVYRDRNYYWFQQAFLGTTDLAKECKILNPEVLYFDYNDTTNTLRASSDDFLIIENNALGYRIKYLLADFSGDITIRNIKYSGADFSDDFTIRDIKYRGSVLFENMKGSVAQERAWAKKREQVYAPSSMHLLRAMLNGQLDEDGFRVLQYIITPNTQRPPDSLISLKIAQFKQVRSMRDSLSYWTKKAALPKVFETLAKVPLELAQLLRKTDIEGIYAFGSDHNDLFIEYSKSGHFHANDKFSNLTDSFNHEATAISFSSAYIFFDDNGWIKNPNDVSMLGAWEHYRVAGMLPSDYEPAQGNAIPNKIVVADTSNLGKQLVKLKGASDSLNDKHAAEKIYIQFDKPYYASGDTIWFKAYVLNNPTYFLSSKSRLLHIDIATDSNKMIKQYLFPVQEGLAWGKIGLDENNFKPGSYIIRAYTQWMQNFGNDVFYYKNIQITGANEGGWLVNTNINSTQTADKQNTTAKLQFTTANKTAIANELLQLRVMAGNKILYKQSVKTDRDGLLDVNFALPGKVSSASLVAENAAKDKKATIPLLIAPENKIDLQFLPEGGDLVAGFTTRIGFKAIGADGKGINISGIITDQNQKQVAAFQSAYNGIGSFDLSAEKGAQYTAQVNLGNGAKNTYVLPAVKASGTFLQVKNLSDDSLEVNLAATSDVAKEGYFLVGKSRGVICYAAVAGFGKTNFIRSKIAKSLFPPGITHFILMTPQEQPLNERLVYIDRHNDLHIDIEPGQAAYAPKDSIAMHIKVTDRDGQPVVGNFSVAVTDNTQVRTDSLNDENILTRLLLTSDLKGYMEGPGYYFQDNKAAKQALDNLLLTQGWVSYEPTGAKMRYEAETGYKVSGRVNNIFNKAIKKTEMVLLSTRPQIIMDTVTDKDGRFVFNHFPRIDTPVFVIKTNNRDFNVNINIDETVPPVFNAPKTPLSMPWYVNIDSTLMNFMKSSVQMMQQDYYPGGGRALKEVKITAKKTVQGSYNLNGPGNADVVLDEKQLENSGKKNWRKLFEENIRGIREVDSLALVNNIYVLHRNFYVHEKPLVLLVDGVIVSRLFNTWDFRQFIEFHDAEDIKGIEVITSAKYTAHYMRVFFPQAPLDSCVFVEVTTRSGNPLLKNTPGLYLYKPLPISWPKQFYKPKYKVTDTAKTIDLRSTIDWEPNVSTDQNGEATVWFYAGSQPSTYSIIIQGVDGNGLLGYKRQKIVISPMETAKSK